MAWNAARWSVIQYVRNKSYTIRQPASRHFAHLAEDLVDADKCNIDPEKDVARGVFDPWPDVDSRIWAESLIGRLPKRKRQAMFLYCKGFNYTDIARIMGIAPCPAREYVIDGARKLRETEDWSSP